ncbi:hypothetical protein QQF64_027820 [Cirrhinus molitorella]|uniref:Uncharacterized protein n=1 Tax=Cirrhinus molitorella TaxID=172907 RepID=A0ABR3NDG3_9TELE
MFALVRLEEREIRLIFREKPNQTDFNVNERVVDPVWTEIFKRLNPNCFLWEGAHPEKMSFTDDESVANGFYTLNLDKSVKTLFAQQGTCAEENNNKQTIKSLMGNFIKQCLLGGVARHEHG